MTKTQIAIVAVLALFGVWGIIESNQSGDRCIAAGHTYSHCRAWGMFW